MKYNKIKILLTIFIMLIFLILQASTCDNSENSPQTAESSDSSINETNNEKSSELPINEQLVSSLDFESGFKIDFFDNDLTGWESNSNYYLSAVDGRMVVTANKKGSPFEAFTYNFDEQDISTCPVVSVTLTANKDVNLSVILKDSAGNITPVSAIQPAEIVMSPYDATVTFDMSVVTKVDYSKINTLSIVLNRSSADCDAVISIKEIAVGGKTGAAPCMVSVPEQQTYINSPEQTILLRGIRSALPKKDVSIEISDYDSSLISEPIIQYNGKDTATLTYKPIDNVYGKSSVSLSLTADGCPTSNITTFDILIEKNMPPVFEQQSEIFLAPGQKNIVTITGVDDGNPNARQNIQIEADCDLLPIPAITYTSDDRWVYLTFDVPSDFTGEANLTLTLKDDGGTAAGGENSAVYNCKILPSICTGLPGVNESENTGLNEIAEVITGYEDNFEGSVPNEAWTSSGEGCHEASIEDGALKIAVDKTITNNEWAGLWYQPWTEIDLSNHPFISLKIKTDKPGTDMCIYLWDINDVYNTANAIKKVVKAEYTEYFFDFSNSLLSSDGRMVDAKHIRSLLINFAPGKIWTGTFWFEDLRIGDRVDVSNIAGTLRIDKPEDLSIPINAGEQSIIVSGLNDGKGNVSNITLTAKSSDTTIISSVSVSSVQDGKAELNFSSEANVTGTTTITLRAEAENAAPAEESFIITIAPDTSNTPITVTVDRTKKYQTIDGFGAFMGTGQVSVAMQEQYINYANDIGMSIARFGIIDVDFEPVNDNSNPMVTDYTKFNTDALPLQFMKRLQNETSIDKFVITIWSPPAWMKKSKSQGADDKAFDNLLDPSNYEEYAEEMVALIKTVKEKTGIDIYALSLQNEPQFNEFYASSILLKDEYTELIKIVGSRFEKENISTKIFMPEALPQQGGIIDYIKTLNADPEASKYVDIIGIHNYDTDGIHVGGAGADEWRKMYEATQVEPKKKLWMTETSGHANNREGAMELAGNIYNALHYGNAGSWIWWSFGVPKSSEVFGLLVDGIPSARYMASKQFYKFIQPEAVRVDTLSDNESVAAVSFDTPDGKGNTTVLINTGSEAHYVHVQGDNMPKTFSVYETSPHKDCEKLPDGNGIVFLPPNSVITLVGIIE